jgi:hypothetical protein
MTTMMSKAVATLPSAGLYFLSDEMPGPLAQPFPRCRPRGVYLLDEPPPGCLVYLVYGRSQALVRVSFALEDDNVEASLCGLYDWLDQSDPFLRLVS